MLTDNATAFWTTSAAERFIRKIDPKIVKDFLNETVSNFCIKDGLTTSILLKNGIELRFSYKTAE